MIVESNDIVRDAVRIGGKRLRAGGAPGRE